MKKNQKKSIALWTLGLLSLIGTYNAVMINSESLLSLKDAKNFKRLDEILGEEKAGRSLAVTTEWKKLSGLNSFNEQKTEESSTPREISAINDSLNLQLVEVVNPSKWQQGIKETEFSGSLATNNGIIESLNVSLPEGLSIEISFSEMNGNVFEYDLNGEVFSGMMYQVDSHSYMVSMTNGPLEGTRMRFNSESTDHLFQSEQIETYLAEKHEVQVGNFGEEIPETIEVATDTASPNVEAATFQF
jgi:hypothetical protein